MPFRKQGHIDPCNLGMCYFFFFSKETHAGCTWLCGYGPCKPCVPQPLAILILEQK